jgi:MoxR-like ATPase
MTSLSDTFKRIETEIARVVWGQPLAIRIALLGAVGGGNILAEDLPGVGKTLMAKAIGRTLGLAYRRFQGTADRLPSDITGYVRYDQQGKPLLVPGPIFCQFFHMDEINRMPPKAQDGVVEAGQEYQVTIDGNTFDLPKPFVLMATQNPHDLEGTFPLSYAVADRFALSYRMGYPDHEKQWLAQASLSGKILAEPEPTDQLQVIGSSEWIMACRQAIREVRMDERLIDYAYQLVNATRPAEEPDGASQAEICLGLSPRAALHLVWFARAHALLVRGDTLVLSDDVKAVFLHVASHRVILRRTAIQNFVRSASVLSHILKSVPNPDMAHVGRR